MKTNSFACSLKSDFYRMSKLKSIWIALAIMFGFVLLNFAVYWFTLNIIPQTIDGDFYAMQQKTVLEQGRGLLFGSSSQISIGIFMAIITSIMIGCDFSGGFVSIMTAKGTSRATTYFSKWLTLVVLAIGYVLFGVLLSGIFYSFTTFDTVFTALDFGYLMRNILMQILATISLVSIFVMIAFMSRSKGSSMAVALLSYIIVEILISIISAILVTKYGSEYSDTWTYFMPFMQMTVACKIGSMKATEIVAGIVMPIVYTAISSIIGYFSFEKRDIK